MTLGVKSRQPEGSIIEQDFEAGRVYYARIVMVPGIFWWHGKIAPVSETQALAEMKKLKPLDKDKVEVSAAQSVALEPLQ